MENKNDNYCSKNGFQHMSRKRIQRYKFPWNWANYICRTKSYGVYQKELTQNGWNILVKLKGKKDSIRHPNRKKLVTYKGRGGGAGDVCRKANRLAMKKQASFFVPLFGLWLWQSQGSSFLNLTFPICKLKGVNKYELLDPFWVLKYMISWQPDEEDKFQTLGFRT